MFYRNKKLLLVGISVLALSFPGILLVNSLRDSVSPNVIIKPEFNVSSLDGNEGDKKETLDSNSPLSISIEGQFKRYLNNQTSEETLRVRLETWLKERPVELLNYILQMRDAQLQLKFLIDALEIWRSIAPGALHHWVVSVQENNAMTVLCGKEAFAPQLCVQYAQKLTDLKQQNNVISHQLRHWAFADSDAVLAWVVNSDEIYKRFGVEVFSYVIELDFDSALFSLSQLIDRDLFTSTEIADLIVKRLYQSQNSFQSDTSAVANAVLSLSDSKFRDMLLLSSAPVLFQLGDTYNSMVLLEAMTDGLARESLQHNFVRQLTEQQGAEEALRYLERLSDGVQKQELIGSVIMQWSGEDIVAAHDWFKAWDNAIPETALSLAQVAIEQKNIPIAMELLDRLNHTPYITLETAEYNFQLAKLMYSDDPESAIMYLENNLELSTENKKVLIAYLINTQN